MSAISNALTRGAGILRFCRRLFHTLAPRRTAAHSPAAASDAYLSLFAIKRDELLSETEQRYLQKVAGGAAIDALRRVTGSASPTPSSVNASSTSAESLAGARMRRAPIYLVSEHTPSVSRCALRLFRIEGLSHLEIAQRLRISQNMVGPHIAEALRDNRDISWGDSRGNKKSAAHLSPYRNLDLSNEAIDWIVRLGSGSATITDQATFTEWQARSPAHIAASHEMMLLLHSIGHSDIL